MKNRENSCQPTLTKPFPFVLFTLFHFTFRGSFTIDVFLFLVGRLHSSSRLDVARRHLAILLSLHTARYAWDTKEGIISVYEMFPLYGALHDSLFRDQQITVNFISRAFPSFLFKIFRPDN